MHLWYSWVQCTYVCVWEKNYNNKKLTNWIQTKWINSIYVYTVQWNYSTTYVLPFLLTLFELWMHACAMHESQSLSQSIAEQINSIKPRGARGEKEKKKTNRTKTMLAAHVSDARSHMLNIKLFNQNWIFIIANWLENGMDHLLLVFIASLTLMQQTVVLVHVVNLFNCCLCPYHFWPRQQQSAKTYNRSLSVYFIWCVCLFVLLTLT